MAIFGMTRDEKVPKRKRKEKRKKRALTAPATSVAPRIFKE